MVLPKGQLHLALPTVASHQSAVGVLPATVTGQKLQAYRDTAGVVARVQAQSAEPIECVEIAKTQVLTSDHRPLLVGIVGKKLALIKPGRRLKRFLCLYEFCTGEVLMGSFKPFLENLNIKPDV